MSKPILKPGSQIAVVLSPRPKPISIPTNAAFFDFAGERFEDTGLAQHNGFYDFLRARSGAIIGVRYEPFGDAALVLKTVPETEGLKYHAGGKLGELILIWGPGKEFDPDTSVDQYFGNNIIYRGKPSGTLAVGFAIDPLSPQEVISFRQILDTD
jgi:hypothetical protein